MRSRTASRTGCGRSLDTAYFLRHDAQEIAWQTRNLHYRVDTDKPVVKARLAPFGEGLQVMIYTRDREALFARICGYFERAGFNIAEAKVHTTRNGYALDTFVVMGQGRDAHYRTASRVIETELPAELQSRGARSVRRAAAACRAACGISRSRPRSTSVPTSAARITRCRSSPPTGPACSMAWRGSWRATSINLQTARINTLGDRAEDVFLVSGETLANSKKVLQLEQELLEALSLPETAPQVVPV